MMITDLENMSEKTRQEMCYELYKSDWYKKLFEQSPEEPAATIIDYFSISEFDRPKSFDQYLNENGYYGRMYANFDEFIVGDYQDKEYMAELLDVPVEVLLKIEWDQDDTNPLGGDSDDFERADDVELATEFHGNKNRDNDMER